MTARLTIFFIIIAVAVGTNGCGSGSSGGTSQTSQAQLKALSITAVNSTFAAGRQAQFSATGTFSDGTTRFVKVDTWSSSNPAVAPVDQNGRVTAKVSGSTSITASSGSVQTTSSMNVVTLKTKFIYVSIAAPGVNKLAGFSIDSTTGQLTPLPGSPFDINASFVTADPLGRFLFVANGATTAYSIDPQTGSLTPASFSADSMFVSSPNLDPTTRFLYSANNQTNGSSINGSTVNLNNGALTTIPGSPWSASGLLDCFTFDRLGQFLFLCDIDTNHGDSGVAAFQIDQNSGALSMVSGSPFVEQGTKIQPGHGPATVGDPISIVIGSSGNFLYAFNGDECELATGTSCPEVEVYKINQSTGALQVVYPQPLPIPATGVFIQHPNGNWLYAPEGDFHATGQINGLALNDATATVTALPSMPVSAGGLCPSQPAFNDDASRLYVVNQCDTTISVFAVNPDGSLTLEQTPAVTALPFMASRMAVVSVPQ